MRLVVGCPIYERGWIIREWILRFVDQARPTFVFVYTPSEDDTAEAIVDMCEMHGFEVVIATFADGVHSKERDWQRRERIETMAAMRNRLLSLARALDPWAFLSLDSDVLVSGYRNFRLLFEDLKEVDVVAPLVYLGRGEITNAFTNPPRQIHRRLRPFGGLQPADVVCAAKLISRTVLMDESVRYGYNQYGEDFAWSESVRDAGYRMAWDSRVRFKHVMEPSQLNETDPRIGW